MAGWGRPPCEAAPDVGAAKKTLPRFSELGDCALLLQAPPPLDIRWQERIWALAAAVREWAGVSEVMPGMNNMMVRFDPLAVPADDLRAAILALWPRCSWDGGKGKTVEVPVVYGGEHGMDLQHVAAHAGLSVPELVRLHSQARYTVYFLGGYPGFGYLGGLPAQLFTPRRAVPRPQVPPSSVAIGGSQAGVIPTAVPSGWHVIGQAREVFFDLARNPPALLEPGDEVRFRIESIEP